MNVNETAASVALSLVGLTWPDDDYNMAVDPGGSKQHRYAIGRDASGCMLIRLRVEELVVNVEARAEYEPDTAQVLLARRAGGSPMHFGGACRPATIDSPPLGGDGIWYGAVPGYPEHVETATIVLADGPSIKASVVAGGERKNGKETVALLARSLSWTGHVWVCEATRRPVIAVLDIGELARIHGLRG